MERVGPTVDRLSHRRARGWDIGTPEPPLEVRVLVPLIRAHAATVDVAEA